MNEYEIGETCGMHGVKRNGYKCFSGKTCGRTPDRWTENVKLGLNETEWENVGGIHPA